MHIKYIIPVLLVAVAVGVAMQAQVPPPASDPAPLHVPRPDQGYLCGPLACGTDPTCCGQGDTWPWYCQVYYDICMAGDFPWPDSAYDIDCNTYVCETDPFCCRHWDAQCALLAENCTTCYDAVCVYDPFCCDSWDAQCDAIYQWCTHMHFLYREYNWPIHEQGD